MPRDHYVARTYLKHFAGSDGLLHAYRKSDGRHFPCRPRDICHEWNGDTINEFLSAPNMLGDYRKIVEPTWDLALSELKAGRISRAEKMAVAGYWANVLVCTPAWQRAAIASHNAHALRYLHAHDRLQTKYGNPDPKLTEALAAIDSGTFSFETKPDFIKAMNASNLLNYAWALYHSDWIVIANDTDIAFLTSDNPAAFEDPGPWRGDRRGLPRYLPVTPALCLFCIMREAPRHLGAPNFEQPPRGVIRRAAATPRTVRTINTSIVRCAEDLVLATGPSDAVAGLTTKYARHRVHIDLIECEGALGETLIGLHTRVREG